MMMRRRKRNLDIRNKIERQGLLYHRVAARIGISPYSLSHWLMTDLTPERKALILKAIDELQEEVNSKK